MNRTIYKLILCGLFATFISCIKCSVDPLSPQALEGSWEMLAFTDKEMNITFERGKPTDIGNGVTRTMWGFLSFEDWENEHLIEISILTRTTIPSEGEHDSQEETSGLYSINGSSLTIVEFITGDTKIFRISRSGFRLTPFPISVGKCSLLRIKR